MKQLNGIRCLLLLLYTMVCAKLIRKIIGFLYTHWNVHQIRYGVLPAFFFPFCQRRYIELDCLLTVWHIRSAHRTCKFLNHWSTLTKNGSPSARHTFNNRRASNYILNFLKNMRNQFSALVGVVVVHRRVYKFVHLRIGKKKKRIKATNLKKKLFFRYLILCTFSCVCI